MSFSSDLIFRWNMFNEQSASPPKGERLLVVGVNKDGHTFCHHNVYYLQKPRSNEYGFYELLEFDGFSDHEFDSFEIEGEIVMYMPDFYEPNDHIDENEQE